MALRLSSRWGCPALLAFLLVPGCLVASFLHSPIWLVITPAILVCLMLAVAALRTKRKITPQEWANELERHLLGTEGPYDWDDTTAVTLADERLESLRSRVMHDFHMLDTPEKREEFRQIIEALRRGEVP